MRFECTCIQYREACETEYGSVASKIAVRTREGDMARSNVKSGRQDLVRRRAEPASQSASEGEREGTAKEQRCLFSFAAVEREGERRRASLGSQVARPSSRRSP